MTKNCRRCLTDVSNLGRAEDEVRRIARLLARTERPSKIALLKERLAIAKANLTETRGIVTRGHECDTRLSDEHWTKAGV